MSECVHEYECVGSVYHHSYDLVSVCYECDKCGDTFEEDDYE